jgi:hypothetical protein
VTPKERYRILCEYESTIPIFSRAWWLDAVCGYNWDVCLVEKGDHVLAAMPYFIKKRYGFTLLTHPQLCQNLGPWLRPSDAKYPNRLAKEKDLFTVLIDQLPDFEYFRQNWNHTNTNWLPFYWRGFQQTTRYTYRLADLSDIEMIWSGFRENIRGDIRKATNRFNLHVRSDGSIEDFLALNAQTFDRQGLVPPYSPKFVQELDQACAKRDARKIFIAEDEEGQKHAGVYIIWDEQSAYYLMGGGDPKLRSSGATSLCMWEAIKFASTKTMSFDFEGSMIEPVERFFRAFGATQTPYFVISKTQSRIIKGFFALKSLS